MFPFDDVIMKIPSFHFPLITHWYDLCVNSYRCQLPPPYMMDVTIYISYKNKKKLKYCRCIKGDTYTASTPTDMSWKILYYSDMELVPCILQKCYVLWVIWQAIRYQRHDIRPVCWEQSRLYIYIYISCHSLDFFLALATWGLCVTLLHSCIPIIKNIALCIWNALVSAKTKRGISTINIWYVCIYMHIYGNDYGIMDFKKCQISQGPWERLRIMRRWTGSTLVQIMACRLNGAKPLSELVLTYCQLDPKEHISMIFYLNFKYFHSRKCVWTCRLGNGRYFVRGVRVGVGIVKRCTANGYMPTVAVNQ